MDMFGIYKDDEDKHIEQVNLENNLSSKTNTKSLQNYMANPDDDLKRLIGNKKYEGPIDGVKNDELDELIKYLEIINCKNYRK